MKSKNHVKEKRKRHNVCASCHCLIDNEVYSKCLKCKNYCQCLHCLSKGKQTYPHLKEHPFILIAANERVLYDKDWTVLDEINLLLSLQQHGIDDWDSASKFVQTKTPEQCFKHFQSIYIHSTIQPLPEPLDSSNMPPQLDFFTIGDDEISDPSLSSPKNLKAHRRNVCSTYGEWSGYMPKRHDFDSEFNRSAESDIHDLFFDNTFDTENTFEEKLNLLRKYSDSVELREKSHQFVESENLINEHLGKKVEKYHPKDDIDKLLFPFMKYVSFEKLKEIKKRLLTDQESIKNAELIEELINEGASSNLTVNCIQIMRQVQNKPELTQLNVHKKISMLLETHESKAELPKAYLSTQEIQFCENTCLDPQKYIELKDQLMLEYIKEGNPFSREDLKKFAPDKFDLIINLANFLEEQGFIKCTSD